MPRPLALRRLAILAAVTVSLFVGTVPVGAATQKVRSSGLSATFTYHGTSPISQHPHLTISDNGKVVYDQAVSSRWCGTECSANTIAEQRKVVHILHVDGSGPPSVVLDLYSGGAHCCFIEQVYSLRAHSTVVHKAEYNFGNPGVELIKLTSGYGFLSANNAFAYAFTDFAASGMPIEIFNFSDNKFHNVTRSYPHLIQKDADRWLSAFRSQASSHYQDSVGLVAAWAADEDMLGHSAVVEAFLAAQATAGHLNSAISPYEASGHKYVVALQKFLHKYGYLQ